MKGDLMLKELLGDAYKEGMTLAEIETALSGKKLVDLSTGKYVDKEKYDRLNTEHSELKTQFDEYKKGTSDFETIKKEYETLKGEKADNDLRDRLVALGVNPKSFKYVKSDINDKALALGEDEKANKSAVEKYLKENPQFANQQSKSRIIVTHNEPNQEGQSKNDGIPAGNLAVNDAIRNAFGVKSE